jgi:hypothetical protein
MIGVRVEGEESDERRCTDGEVVQQRLLGESALARENGTAECTEPKCNDRQSDEIKYLGVTTLQEKNLVVFETSPLLPVCLDGAANCGESSRTDEEDRPDDEPADVAKAEEDIEERKCGEKPD